MAFGRHQIDNLGGWLGWGESGNDGRKHWLAHRGPTASDAPPKPVSPSERIDAIDVLRGFALFGVPPINIVTIFRVSIFAQFLPNAEPAGPLDRAVAAVLTVAVDFKAL